MGMGDALRIYVYRFMTQRGNTTAGRKRKRRRRKSEDGEEEEEEGESGEDEKQEEDFADMDFAGYVSRHFSWLTCM